MHGWMSVDSKPIGRSQTRRLEEEGILGRVDPIAAGSGPMLSTIRSYPPRLEHEETVSVEYKNRFPSSSFSRPGSRTSNPTTFLLALFSGNITQYSLKQMAASTNTDQASILDITAHPTAQKLHARCAEFFAEVEDL